jgi:nicotinamidase-related amidase
MKTAVLVIDVQRGLFDDEPRPFEADDVVERINLLCDRARAGDVPVIFIQHERAASPLAHGSDLWQLERNLRIGPGDRFVAKTTPDAFLGTALQTLLESLDVDHVVVCGYASEFCVDTTTRRAAALGYPVTLAADAHTTKDKPHASAEAIRAHENATLPEIVSFGPAIRAVASADIRFQD